MFEHLVIRELVFSDLALLRVFSFFGRQNGVFFALWYVSRILVVTEPYFVNTFETWFQFCKRFTTWYLKSRLQSKFCINFSNGLLWSRISEVFSRREAAAGQVIFNFQQRIGRKQSELRCKMNKQARMYVCGDTGGLTQDGIAEPDSRKIEFSGVDRGQGKFHFPFSAVTTGRIGNDTAQPVCWKWLNTTHGWRGISSSRRLLLLLLLLLLFVGFGYVRTFVGSVDSRVKRVGVPGPFNRNSKHPIISLSRCRWKIQICRTRNWIYKLVGDVML